MFSKLKKLFAYSLMAIFLSACSSSREFTTDTDEMDIGNTVGFIIGAAAIIYAASEGGGGGSYCNYEPSLRDYQPGNNQWVCRSINTGQYTEACNCDGQDYVDNWQ